VVGYIEPLDEGDYEFVDKIYGGAIPSEYIPACDKGFRSTLEKGSLIGFPIVGVRAVLTDGNSHAVDSSDMAFQIASRIAFRHAYRKASPKILEPVMKVSVEGPGEFQGAIYRSLMQRRGTVLGSTEDAGFARVDAEVPLAEMFGYSTDLRSATQGKAEFTMEFARYSPAPREVSEELLNKYKGQGAEEDDS
jgi:elongation factor G